MGVGVEAWRARVGSWNCRAAKGTRQAGGPGGLGNLLLFLLSLVVTFLGERLDAIPLRLKTYKWRARVVLDLMICVFLILLVVSALVAYKLVFDVETNPGPGPPAHVCRDPVRPRQSQLVTHLLQTRCPGAGVLGPQAGALHLGNTTDPLESLLGSSTYTRGGAARYITSLSTAITTFIQRAYPTAGGKGLLVVPVLPSTTDDITWDEVTRHSIQKRHGGLLIGRFFFFKVAITTLLR